MSRPRVVVVGAGIVGLSTAYGLIKRGCEVTVVERGPIPSPLASSSDHHRLIRRIYGDRTGYTLRSAEAFAAWRTMFSDLSGPQERYYAPRGILALSAAAGDYTDRSRETMTKLGISLEVIHGDRLKERFPFLLTDGVAYGLLSEGGALMANAILFDLSNWLRQKGAVVREYSTVTHVDHKSAAVELDTGERIEADRVVLAAGVGSAALGGQIGQCLSPHRSLVVYADPPADLASAFARAPCWTDLGTNNDLWGMPSINGLPMKLGNGSMGREDSDDADRTMTPDERATMIESYATRFADTNRFALRWGMANYWTLAPDRRFLLVEMDRTLLVSACSGHGFKFGALTGDDVASVLTGERPFRQAALDLAGHSLADQENIDPALEPWVNL